MSAVETKRQQDWSFLVECQAGLIVSDHFPWKVEHKIYMSKTKSKFYTE